MDKSNCISLAAALFALIGNAGYADKANDTLNVSIAKSLESLDSYYSNSREGMVMSRAIWDNLLYRNPVTNEYSGNLATEWEWIDDLTIEFKLREGVTFHNGEAFNADDVVFTIDYVTNVENGVLSQSNVNWMKNAEKIDDYTVRLNLKTTFPAALEYLSGAIAIYPDEYYGKVGANGMNMEPVGTGPYRVTSVDPGKRFVLEAFEDRFESPKKNAQISTVDVRVIPDVNAQLAELFTGNLDLVWQVPADMAEKMEGREGFVVKNESTMRVAYLPMDAAGRTGADNPFTKLEVRQAVNHAIDRQAIVDNLLKGESKVIWTACFPSQFGCTEDVQKYPYDPERAKSLLAEAGYPDGFTTDFYAYRDREYAEAIASYLNAVGIKTNFRMLQYSALRDLNSSGEVPIGSLTWGSSSINDASAMVSHFFKHGDQDDARDDAVLAALEAADSSTDPEVRKDNYATALNIIAEQAYWAPLFSYNTNYIMTDEVSYTPTTDEVLRFNEASWK
ncbi:ABC transporter substrate-binding protein [Roseovarius sp. S1116L3]|uniref:ABC transporter substrate-binding protein n=1 Tax=Roseovarius roseus TaxID=3342636 RepID=UPI003727082C